MGKIILKGLKFNAFHGVYADEKLNGNTFVVDVEIKTDTAKAQMSDELIDTLDYVTIYHAVKIAMETPSNLLENVAFRINDAISEHLKKGKIKTTIYKKNPPIGGKCKYTSVTLKTKIK